MKRKHLVEDDDHQRAGVKRESPLHQLLTAAVVKVIEDIVDQKSGSQRRDPGHLRKEKT